MSRFCRTQMVLGSDNVRMLSRKKVAVFGLGGVGGNACDALARSGVGAFVLIDNDVVCESNINRQLIANTGTLGMQKVDAMERHLLSINPDVKVEKKPIFYLPETANTIDFEGVDYVVDAIDTVTAKIDIIVRCRSLGIPVISALGCGNKVDPTQLLVTDIYKTSYDPLAKVLRRELRKRGVDSLTVVCSKESPITPLCDTDGNAIVDRSVNTQRRSTPGSTAFVPPVAGIMMASVVVRDLIGFDPTDRK